MICEGIDRFNPNDPGQRVFRALRNECETNDPYKFIKAEKLRPCASCGMHHGKKKCSRPRCLFSKCQTIDAGCLSSQS